MTKITIRPAWTFISDAGERVDPQLFELLAAIHDLGKLTLAAKQVKLSYRYAWGLLDRWQSFFGSPLVTMERGRGATLSSLGAKLLWAEQRSDANLFPQLENIASELNLEIGRALRRSESVLQIHGSHGYAVEKLPALMHRHGHATVDLQYMGSLDALASLSRGGCDLAGFHVPFGTLAPTFWRHYGAWLNAGRHRIIRLVTRKQGLIVARGNPLGIEALGDLARPGVRFVNRQSGSGTRILLDALMQIHRLDSQCIQGYATGEFTHAAVAAFVASGMADVGFGVEPAAHQFRLGFVPMVAERYMLACQTDALDQPAIQELLTLLRGSDFAQMIGPVPGYDLDAPGTVETVQSAMQGVGVVQNGPSSVKQALRNVEPGAATTAQGSTAGPRKARRTRGNSASS